MRKRSSAVVAIVLITAGCAAQAPDAGGGVGNVSEAVVALAAPGQNLATARLVPKDGCYWYEHKGPVETTLLPLRTVNGNPICTARES
jgi:hypothetical protein